MSSPSSKEGTKNITLHDDREIIPYSSPLHAIKYVDKMLLLQFKNATQISFLFELAFEISEIYFSRPDLRNNASEMRFQSATFEMTNVNNISSKQLKSIKGNLCSQTCCHSRNKLP